MEYAPAFSFQGFRYVRLDACPSAMTSADFAAVVVHSNIERTGDFTCGVELVNKLYENILWGQRGNFLDVPTTARSATSAWAGPATRRSLRARPPITSAWTSSSPSGCTI